MTKETQVKLEQAAQCGIADAERIAPPGVTISAWADFGGADEGSVPLIIKVEFEADDEDAAPFPSKKERLESVVRALWNVGIYAVDREEHLGRFVELYADNFSADAESCKLVGMRPFNF